MYISLGKIKQSPTGMFRDRALQRKNQPQWQELIENMGGGGFGGQELCFCDSTN